MKKKILALVLVFALALAMGIGGTLAWLTASSKTVTNTFTFGDINIKLTETGVDGETVTSKTFDSLVPGETVAKDPKVTVAKGSEKCYVFVKIVEQNNDAGYIAWDVDTEKWELVPGETNVYRYIVDGGIVDASEAEKELYILDNKADYPNGFVVVDGEAVTKAYVKALNDKTLQPPALVFTAYAVQSDNVQDAAAAWEIANPEN